MSQTYNKAYIFLEICPCPEALWGPLSLCLRIGKSRFLIQRSQGSYKPLPENGNSELTCMSLCHGTHFPLAWPHFPVLGTGAVISSTGSRKVSLAGYEPLYLQAHTMLRAVRVR